MWKGQWMAYEEAIGFKPGKSQNTASMSMSSQLYKMVSNPPQVEPTPIMNNSGQTLYWMGWEEEKEGVEVDKWGKPLRSICPICETKYGWPPNIGCKCTNQGCKDNWGNAPDLISIPNNKEGKEVPPVPKVKVAAICYGCKVPLCETCNACEETACVLRGRAITTRLEMIYAGLVVPKTQKALGFHKLSSVFGLTVPTPYTIITDEEDFGQVKMDEEMFFRPCPVRPRHGFVESRKMISTPENIKWMWEQARAVDPQAELIVCKAIEASHNAIITPSMLAIGPGHDGATGGHQSISLPLMGVLPRGIHIPEKLKEAGVDVNIHDPYVEVVKSANFGGWIYTQIRAGAKVPKAPDYVPEKIRVESIIEASGDLLEWEQQVQKIERGTVVVHLGGTLISHYGVHCLTNKVPILTTRMPRIGEILNPIGEEVQHEPQHMVKGLALGALMPMDHDTMHNMLPLMMTILHNSPAMGNGYGVWVGFAAAIMVRAGMAASHGEARHAGVPKGGRPASTRETIYELSFDDFFGSRETLGKAQYDFKYSSFPASSFGGAKWADCTESIFTLDKAIRKLLQRPSEETRVGVINAFNISLNKAHNGGWWLDKFVNQIVFTEASRQSLQALLSAANAMVTAKAYFDTISEDQWKAAAFRWRNAGEILVKEREEEPEYEQDPDEEPIEDDPDVEDSSDEDVADDPEPEEDAEDYDHSIGINPHCCSGCEQQYDEAVANKKAEIANLQQKNPEVVNKVYEPSTPKAKKVPFNPNLDILKAHVRFEKQPSGNYTTHVQCLVGEGQYWSFDGYAKGEAAKWFDNWTIPANLFEGSYSSNAGGYIPVPVFKVIDGWRFTIVALELFLTFGGVLENVALSPEPQDGQTEETQTEAEETETPSLVSK